MSALMDRLWSALDREGSMRSAALIRMGLAAICWDRFADEMILWETWQHTDRMVLGLLFLWSTTFLFFGWFTRVANAVLAFVLLAQLYYLGLWLDIEPYRHHHTTILAYAVTWLLALPSGRSYSVDRWLAVRRAERDGVAPPPETGPTWGLMLLGLQISVVYFFGAWDKTYWAYGERMEQIFQYAYFGSEAPGAWFVPSLAFLGLATVVLEYALCFGLWVKRWQWWLVPSGILLHAIIFVALPVKTFSATMLLLYLAYVDPDRVHGWLERLQGHDPVPAA